MCNNARCRTQKISRIRANDHECESQFEFITCSVTVVDVLKQGNDQFQNFRLVVGPFGNTLDTAKGLRYDNAIFKYYFYIFSSMTVGQMR